jgi:RNA polymerase sigma-70 factor (ECF subfamily)
MPEFASNDYRPFPVTPWSLVGRAANATVESRRESLGQLLQRYLPALKTHLTLKKRIPPHKAEDLVQGFIADKVVASEILSYADRERGKFRTFLCTALDHYAVSQNRMARAKKRSPGDGGAVGDLDDAPEPADSDGADPADSFDVSWARQVIDQSVELMRQECISSKRPELWELFDLRVLGPTLRGVAPPPYEQLVARSKALSPLQLSNQLVTAKRMFTRILRNVISEYARDESEVEEEIRDLKVILARAGAG